jgi:hypothetical protein
LRFFGLILENILGVFLSSLCRETAKNAIKKIEGKNAIKSGQANRQKSKASRCLASWLSARYTPLSKDPPKSNSA